MNINQINLSSITRIGKIMNVKVDDSQRNVKLIRCKCNAWKYETQPYCRWCERKEYDQHLILNKRK